MRKVSCVMAGWVFLLTGATLLPGFRIPAGALRPSPRATSGPDLVGFAGGDGSGEALDVAQSPYYFAIDGEDIYVSDLTGNAIREIDTATGSETPVAGTGFFGYSGDGGPASDAEVDQPAGVAVDAEGDVFVADQDSSRIREIPARSGTFFGISMLAGDIYTIAGTGAIGYSGDSGPATSAKLALPEDVALDSGGDVVVADTYNGRIREIAATTHAQFGISMVAGDIYTIAGDGEGGVSADAGDGGLATSAEIGTPQGVSVDSSGDVFVTQDLNQDPAPVREISASAHSQFGISMDAGDIYTVAGGTAPTVCADASDSVGDGCPATQATLSDPVDAVPDPAGNLYVTDYYHDRVRVVSATTGTISTYAGTGTGGDSGNGGPAPEATLSFPTGLGFDASGDLLVSDSTSIREIASQSGIIEQIAGNGTFSFSGDGGPALDAQFGAPAGVAFDSEGNAYITDAVDNVVRKVTPAGTISSIAGVGYGVDGIYARGGYSGDGGPAVSAELSLPIGIVSSASGDLYIADSGNRRIREISASGIITTVAGDGSSEDSGEGGPATSAGLSDPLDVALDSAGDIFISDGSGDLVDEVPAETSTQFGIPMQAGNLYAIAGDGTSGYSGDESPARDAELDDPFGVAVDGEGDVFIADRGNHVVREVSSHSGVQFGIPMQADDIYTVAGTGTAGFSGDGGLATGAELNTPGGLAVDPSGDVWVSDTGNHRVREISASSGDITTVVGTGSAGITGEGGPAAEAELANPAAIAFDGSGNAIVGEYSVRSGFGYADANGRVVEVDVSGSAPPPSEPTSPQASAGYWMVGSSGTVYPFGSANNYGSATSLGSAVAIAAVPGGSGYWVVNEAGFVAAFGAAKVYDLSASPTSNVVSIAATPDGNGYWLATSRGQVITAGDAQSFGSPASSGLNLSKPIVNMVATPDGRGYWLLGGDGGVFTYGDAGFYGSTGSIVLNQPAVAMAPTSDGKGYWFVAADGGIFAYGDAGFYGSTYDLNPARPPGGSNSVAPLNKPVDGIVTTADGKGYWIVASDGGVFTFGDAGFVGSLGSTPPSYPIVGFAAA